MKIEKIKKTSSNTYQIVLEDKSKIKTYDEVILKNNLLYKKELDQEEINTILKENEYYSVYSDSIKYLTKKVHSKQEYINYLKKYNLVEKRKKDLIVKMEELNLLNDDYYIKAYIYDKFHLTSDGILKIRNDLLSQNLSKEKIDDELSKIDQEEINDKLEKLVMKKIKSTKGSNYQIRQKVISSLITLGYEKNDIEKYLIDIDDSKSLEKDFNKVYLSLSRKEKDMDTLYFKIKQKLYQKGYNSEDINEIINKKRNY